jgi:hypothetical protein
LKPNRLRPKGTGYVATGPGFYVWEEVRSDALRTARELGPLFTSPPAGGPLPGAALPGRTRRDRRRP